MKAETVLQLQGLTRVSFCNECQGDCHKHQYVDTDYQMMSAITPSLYVKYNKVLYAKKILLYAILMYIPFNL